MARAGRGSIVNVGSVYGLLSPDQGLYDFRRAAGEEFFKPVAYSVSKSALAEPDAVPRDVLGAERRSGQHADAARDRERPARAVRRGVRVALAARAADGRLRGGRRRRLPRVGRLVVRHRREPRRRRRLVGLVSAEAPNLVAGEERPAASGAWLDKTRPADGTPLCRVARSGADDAAAAVDAARAAQPEWAARTAVERGNVVRAIAELLRERREEASELVAAETGKSLALALGETDAAVEMGLFVAGEGRRSYGRTTTASMPNRTVLTLRRPVGVAALLISFNTPLPNVAWKAFPSIFCGNALGAEAVGARAAVGAVARAAVPRGGAAARRAERLQGLGPEAGMPLVEDPRVDLVSFTGSARDGSTPRRGGRPAAREDGDGARRQERARRLRRRRPRPRRRVGARVGVLERRPAVRGGEPHRRVRRRLRRVPRAARRAASTGSTTSAP